MRAILLLILLAGCSGREPMTAEEREQLEARLLKGADFEEVGRFQFSPPTNSFPGVLLDTATGCFSTVTKWTDDNGADFLVTKPSPAPRCETEE